MADQKWPTMTGWRKRELAAKQRQMRQEQMADIREARKRQRMREEGRDVDDGYEVKTYPGEIPSARIEKKRAAEHESPTVGTEYPDPEQMNREELFAYLKAHGHKAAPATKDETLRKRVREVRDGDTG